jgi:hypothetical protein
MDKAPVEAGKAVLGANDKMINALVPEALETGEGAPVETEKEAPVAVDENQTERCTESEDAARDQKIYHDFEPFQNWVPDEVDDEYLNKVAELEEYSRGLWDDMVKETGGFSGFKFADPNDPRCAGFYEWYNPDEVRTCSAKITAEQDIL